MSEKKEDKKMEEEEKEGGNKEGKNAGTKRLIEGKGMSSSHNN